METKTLAAIETTKKIGYSPPPSPVQGDLDTASSKSTLRCKF